MAKQVFTTGQVPTAADFNALAQDANLKGTDTVNAGSGSLAGSVLELTQTWNTTGNPSAISLNVTDTASGASANLMDLKVGGVSKLKLSKSGVLTGTGPSSGSFVVASATEYRPGAVCIGSEMGGASGGVAFGSDSTGAVVGAGASNLGFHAGGALAYGWTSGALATALDTKLYRDAANTVAQRNGVNPNTFRVYNTYTDASNYERGVFDWTTTANTLTIGTQKAGTGAERTVQMVGFNLYIGNNSTDRINLNSHNCLVSLYYSQFSPVSSGSVDLKNTDNNFGWGYALVGHKTLTNTSGTTAMCEVRPTYNQASGTAANTDLLISRTETAVGSGVQKLIDATVNGTSKFSVSNAGHLEAATLRTATAYTVSTLPTGSAGMRAYVTDATAPTFLGALTGGGSVVTPVFHNGSAWVAG